MLSSEHTMKTERRRYAEPPKRRLIVVPETAPYVDDEPPPTPPAEPAVAETPRERPTVRERPVRTDVRPTGSAPESAGRYSHVYGRSSPRKPSAR